MGSPLFPGPHSSQPSLGSADSSQQMDKVPPTLRDFFVVEEGRGRKRLFIAQWGQTEREGEGEIMGGQDLMCESERSHGRSGERIFRGTRTWVVAVPWAPGLSAPVGVGAEPGGLLLARWVQQCLGWGGDGGEMGPGQDVLPRCEKYVPMGGLGGLSGLLFFPGCFCCPWGQEGLVTNSSCTPGLLQGCGLAQHRGPGSPGVLDPGPCPLEGRWSARLCFLHRTQHTTC